MSKIRKLREKRGLSIIELSHILLLHPSGLSMTERQKLSASKRVREGVSKFFRVSEGKLFDKNGMAI